MDRIEKRKLENDFYQECQHLNDICVHLEKLVEALSFAANDEDRAMQGYHYFKKNWPQCEKDLSDEIYVISNFFHRDGFCFLIEDDKSVLFCIFCNLIYGIMEVLNILRHQHKIFPSHQFVGRFESLSRAMSVAVKRDLGV